MSAGECKITARRQLEIERHNNGRTTWQAVQFNHGRSFMLVAETGGTQFTAHFDAEQWLAFQGLISELVSTGAER